MTQKRIKIGTRESPLALAQAIEVKNQLIAAHHLDPDQIEICGMTTQGDQILDRSFVTIGGKMLFTKEIEKALLDKEVDLAVHSLKDLETDMASAFSLGAILKREDPRDAFISLKHSSFDALPEGAIIGSASLRRSAYALSLRPDLKMTLLRGNVGTRYKKLEADQFDATFMAVAGLNRLDKGHLITHKMPIDTMLPAPAQGAIAVQIRSDDTRMKELTGKIHCEQTGICVSLERLFLFCLDGSCKTPIAAHAYIQDNGMIWFKGVVLKPDGSEKIESILEGTIAEMDARIRTEAAKIKKSLSPDFFAYG